METTKTKFTVTHIEPLNDFMNRKSPEIELESLSDLSISSGKNFIIFQLEDFRKALDNGEVNCSCGYSFKDDEGAFCGSHDGENIYSTCPECGIMWELKIAGYELSHLKEVG